LRLAMCARRINSTLAKDFAITTPTFVVMLLH